MQAQVIFSHSPFTIHHSRSLQRPRRTCEAEHIHCDWRDESRTPITSPTTIHPNPCLYKPPPPPQIFSLFYNIPSTRSSSTISSSTCFIRHFYQPHLSPQYSGLLITTPQAFVLPSFASFLSCIRFEPSISMYRTFNHAR